MMITIGSGLVWSVNSVRTYLDAENWPEAGAEVGALIFNIAARIYPFAPPGDRWCQAVACELGFALGARDGARLRVQLDALEQVAVGGSLGAFEPPTGCA